MTVSLFDDCAFNPTLVHQAVVAYMAGGRQGSVAQKTRGQVRGGGRKPWRQKKTGRARAGSIRSPLWRGGGITFAAVPRDHSVRLNRRMYRAAMRSILAEKARQSSVHVLSALEIAEPRTKLLLSSLKEQGFSNGALLVTADQPDENLAMAVRNLPRVSVSSVRQLNPVALIDVPAVLLINPALERVQEWYS